MTFIAVSSACENGCGTLAAQEILPTGDWFEMFWPNTSPITTEVIEFNPARKGAVLLSIGPSVGLQGPPFTLLIKRLKSPVSLTLTADPNPALPLATYLGPETLCGIDLHRLEIKAPPEGGCLRWAVPVCPFGLLPSLSAATFIHLKP